MPFGEQPWKLRPRPNQGRLLFLHCERGAGCCLKYTYIYMYICESEVITWILSIPLDYVLVEVVDGDAEVSEAACVLF